LSRLIPIFSVGDENSDKITGFIKVVNLSNLTHFCLFVKY